LAAPHAAGNISTEVRMSRALLMQSILGHMTLLAEKYPKKAALPLVKRARRAVRISLQPPAASTGKSLRRAA
jgi:hypothetical protein